MEPVFVLCVSKDSVHTPDAILTKCCKCATEVWVSEHNLDKSPICIDCVKQEIRFHGGDFQMGIAKKDWDKAMKYLHREK
jgi:hypothetical protein